MLLVGTQGMTIPHIIGCLFHALLRRFVLSGSCLGGEKNKNMLYQGLGHPVGHWMWVKESKVGGIQSN